MIAFTIMVVLEKRKQFLKVETEIGIELEVEVEGTPVDGSVCGVVCGVHLYTNRARREMR